MTFAFHHLVRNFDKSPDGDGKGGHSDQRPRLEPLVPSADECPYGQDLPTLLLEGVPFLREVLPETACRVITSLRRALRQGLARSSPFADWSRSIHRLQ